MKSIHDYYGIEVYIGEPRSGKTLSMVAHTYEQLKVKPDMKIVSNMWLNPKYFPKYEMFSFDLIDSYYKEKNKFQNTIFLLDEGHQIIDSRNFSKKYNKQIGYLIGMCGKRGNTLRISTHFMRLLDIRVQMYCEKKIYCTKGVIKRVKGKNRFKQLLNFNIKGEDQDIIIQNIEIVRKLVNFEFNFVLNDKNYIIAKDYYDFYDTEEMIYVEQD